jgi:hypothetical protein
VKVCTCRGGLTVEIVSDAEGLGEIMYMSRGLTVEVLSDAEGLGESMYMSRLSDFMNFIEYKV